MNIDEIRLLQTGDILRGEQDSVLDPITSSSICPFETFATDLKNFLLQSMNEDGSLSIQSYLQYWPYVMIFPITETDAMELIDSLDGFNRAILEYTATDKITIKAGSKFIGGERGYLLTQDVEMDIDDDLDAGTKAADTAYNIWFGIDSGDDPIYKFSLSNTAPTGIFSAVCIGCIALDSSSNIKEFTFASGYLNFHVSGTDIGSLVSGTTYNFDLSPFYTSRFSAIVNGKSMSAFWTIGPTYVAAGRYGYSEPMLMPNQFQLTFHTTGTFTFAVYRVKIW